MIVVNVPSMTLHVYNKSNSGYSTVMTSKVVVGRVKNQTPLRDFELISIKYNPSWTPTKNMLNRHLYKNGELDLKWLEDHGLDVIDETGTVRDYSEIENIANPRFVQPSGASNALGNLKFETSSKEDIYLHDTNERHLFSYNTRTYSSGCIRVQDYLKLASVVSQQQSDYIQRNIDTQKMFFEKLSSRVPVYFDYSQVYFTSNSEMKFFADVYSKNKY